MKPLHPTAWEKYQRNPTPLESAKLVAREPYAWPGGYATFLVTADGGTLCPTCVRKEFRSIVLYTKWNQPMSGWCAAGFDHAGNAEESVTCDHCGAVIFDPE